MQPDRRGRGFNFSQATPRTPGILVIGSGPITLIECNLTNVELDPAWTLIRCATVQSWLIVDAVEGHTRLWLAEHPDRLSGVLVPPEALHPLADERGRDATARAKHAGHLARLQANAGSDAHLIEQLVDAIDIIDRMES